jgi:AbrB family looped-hinge helix DNA binding protein
MSIITVSQNGRVTIPADIRKKLKIKKGTELYFMEKDDGIFMTASYAAFIAQMKGSIKSRHGSVSAFLLKERKKDTTMMEAKYKF